jgi:hypothetical protein
VLRAAKATEDLGFDVFSRSDQYLNMGSVSGCRGPDDAWIRAGGLAREDCGGVRLGTLMSPATFCYGGPCPPRWPRSTRWSGSPAESGFGADWVDAEHAGYAIPFAGLRKRFAGYSEQLAIITGCGNAGGRHVL